MNLPPPAKQYDSGNESITRSILEQEDRRNRKLGTDIDIGSERLILRSPDGARWNITVSDAGVLSAAAL